jgi:hypothetical protein
LKKRTGSFFQKRTASLPSFCFTSAYVSFGCTMMQPAPKSSQYLRLARLPGADFDVAALFAALDAQRQARALTWRGVADEIWHLSAALNASRGDHPISPATITGMAERMDTTCQHALFMLRWLGRAPESFTNWPAAEAANTALPVAGPDRRLRWNLKKLYEALDAQRRLRALTWLQLSEELGCSANQLTGIRTARFAISMVLAMRIVQWLERPARDFIYAAVW